MRSLAPEGQGANRYPFAPWRGPMVGAQGRGAKIKMFAATPLRYAILRLFVRKPVAVSDDRVWARFRICAGMTYASFAAVSETPAGRSLAYVAASDAGASIRSPPQIISTDSRMMLTLMASP